MEDVSDGGGADGGEGDPGGVPLGVAPQAPPVHAPDQGRVAPQVPTHFSALALCGFALLHCCCNQLRLALSSGSPSRRQCCVKWLLLWHFIWISFSTSCFEVLNFGRESCSRRLADHIGESLARLITTSLGDTLS